MRLLPKGIEIMNERLPVRQANRLANFDYSSPYAYFVTFCVQGGKCLFWDWADGEWNHKLTPLGQIVDEAIRAVDNNDDIVVDQHVVMPNHVHMIVVLPSSTDAPVHLSNVIRYVKSKVTKAAGHAIWQKSYYDHVIRNQEDYSRIRDYIVNNPGKWKEDRYYSAHP